MGRRELRIAALCSLMMLAGCKTELYAALPEQEANEMIALLMQRNIGAEKVVAKDGTDTIMVDKSHFADAVTTLRDSGFPRRNFETMGDIFKTGGLVASPMQERARFLYALSQELSATISQIDGVLSARVAVVLPEDDILDRSPTPSSASVFVRYDAASDVNKLVPQIKMLVADSVQGLSYDRVSVVLVPATRPVLPPLQPVAGGIVDELLAALAGAGVLAALGGATFVFRQPLQSLLRQMDRRSLRRAPAGEVSSVALPRAIETLSVTTGR